jgi:hypothetical protein
MSSTELREALDVNRAYEKYRRQKGAALNSGPWPETREEREAFQAGWSACMFALINSGQINVKVAG